MSQANLRTVAVLLSLLWCARPDRSYADQAQDEHTLKSIAFSPLNELHIIGADVDADKHLRWAVWSEASEQGSSVRLALVANTVHGPKIVSSLIRDGAFEPTLIRVQNWRHGKHPVIALAYRQGAAAEQVEIYGLDDHDSLVQLASVLGEQIEWRIGDKGQSVMSVYSKPHGRLVAVCYEWQHPTKKLERTACPR